MWAGGLSKQCPRTKKSMGSLSPTIDTTHSSPLGKSLTILYEKNSPERESRPKPPDIIKSSSS